MLSPQRHLIEIARRYPNAWRAGEKIPYLCRIDVIRWSIKHYNESTGMWSDGMPHRYNEAMNYLSLALDEIAAKYGWMQNNS